MMFPAQMARFTGFTESEVQNLCIRYGRDYPAVRDWDRGYELSDIIPPVMRQDSLEMTVKSSEAVKHFIYNPFSVVKTITTGVIGDYWNKTEIYEELAEFINMDCYGLKEAADLLMDGKRLAVDTLTYQKDLVTFRGER